MRLLIALALLLLTLPAHAQPCVPSVSGFPTGPMDPSVSARAFISHMLTWDDGGGESLYIAGQFVVPPFNPAQPAQSYVAQFRGGRWTALRAGLAPASNVNMRALCVQDFSTIGGHGPSLYAAGDGGSLYRWDGASWVLAATAPFGTCNTLLATSDAQGPVILGAGTFGQGVLAWRGQGAWSPYAPLTVSSGSVSRLRLVDDGSGPALYMVGSIRDTTRGISGIAKLVNGQWTPVPHALPSPSAITDITTFDLGQGPELYLCGIVSQGGTTALIHRLRAGQWGPVGAGLTLRQTTLGPTFFKITEGGTPRLYLGGLIEQPSAYAGIIRLSTAGDAWEPPVFVSYQPGAAPTSYGAVHAMARFEGSTFLGGSFSAFTPTTMSVGPTLAYGLLRSDASDPVGFRSTATGLGEFLNSQSNIARYMLTPLQIEGENRLFIAASFARAGGEFTGAATLFDGSDWTPMPVASQYVFNSTLQQAVVTTALSDEPRIVAAAQGPLGPVAVHDGSQWTRLIPQPPGGQGLNVFVLEGKLYVFTELGLSRYDSATNFWQMVTSSSGNTCAILADLGQGPRILMAMNSSGGPGVYAYDGVAPPARVGPNFGPPIQCLAVHDEGNGPTIFVGSSSIPGQIQRLVNGQWQTPGTGLNFTGNGLLSMCSFDDGHGRALYVAGPFSTAGGLTQCNGLARWRNGAWSRVIEPLPGAVGSNPQGLFRACLAVFNNQLYLAGDFLNLAHLNADRLAVIARCPFTCTSDYNQDGDSGTDQDIEAFFACIGGTCCPTCTSDFNNDGDAATDQDIESFFRVLGGGPC
ncbi:MAG TPA: hypothetical protein VD997_06945 [Phycisphaerales bacterium]|nr:hypothetical protein [Phycisphaerales bacterium]